MTSDQIKAELRRSACEDAEPFWRLNQKAFGAACEWKIDGQQMHLVGVVHQRMFLLLVAEAL